jgi:hypothetical protein
MNIDLGEFKNDEALFALPIRTVLSALRLGTGGDRHIS